MPIDIWGDGSVVRDYIYVSDVAAAVVKALIYEGEKSEFNISSGLGYSLNELLNEIERIVKMPLIRNYLDGRPFDVSYNVLDNRLAMNELKWSPLVNLHDGLLKTAEWLNGSK